VQSRCSIQVCSMRTQLPATCCYRHDPIPSTPWDKQPGPLSLDYARSRFVTVVIDPSGHELHAIRPSTALSTITSNCNEHDANATTCICDTCQTSPTASERNAVLNVPMRDCLCSKSLSTVWGNMHLALPRHCSFIAIGSCTRKVSMPLLHPRQVPYRRHLYSCPQI